MFEYHTKLCLLITVYRASVINSQAETTAGEDQ